MGGDSDAVPAGALDDIAFLARSANRVQLLSALASRSYTRRELDETTGIAQTTVSRILAEFQDRGWATRSATGEYTATRAGEHVIAEFTPFSAAMDTIRRLGQAVRWLPMDELPIGLRHFNDATIRRFEQTDPMEMLDHFTDLIGDASEFYGLTHLAPAQPFSRTMRERVDAADLTVTCVLGADLTRYLRGRPDRRDRWRDCIERGADVYRYDGRLPGNLFVIDQRTLVLGGGAESAQSPYGPLIECDTDRVGGAVRDLIARYREASTRLDVEAFAEPA